MNHIVASLLLAAAIPAPAPTPPPTIVTVKASPYCNALAHHFNGAFVPMLANDRTLDSVDTQLVDLNSLFAAPDYQARFIHARDKLVKYVHVLQTTMPLIASEIQELRKGEAMTTDPVAAKALTDAVGELQRAYVKQRAMTIDLQGVVQTMLDYNIDRLPHSLGGNSYDENQLPADMKDVKSALRFDGQRDVIARAEEKAVDTALDAASTYCKK